MPYNIAFRTPLYAAAYWQQAADEFKNIRVLAFAGMVTALAIILESFPIYLLGQSLKIYFSFVVVSLGCACYGPLVGMGVGAVIDTLGFLRFISADEGSGGPGRVFLPRSGPATSRQLQWGS